jgi:cobalt-zinc-cadmium efflux system outer membrane protein
MNLRRRSHRLRVAVALTLLASEVFAEQAPSFPELVHQAEQSPQLIELQATVSAAQGRAQQASAWPNPVLGLELEDFGGSRAYHGTSQAQTTASLSQSLELGGQRSARVAASQSELAAVRAQSVQLRAEFGYELAIAYATAEATTKRIDLLSDDLSRAQEDLRSARALVEAGREGELRGVQADAAVSAAAAELEAARADGIAALAHLSTLVGAEEPFTGVTGSLLIH